RGDVVVGGVAAQARGEDDLDRPGLELERAAVEDDAHRLAARGGEALELLNQVAHRAGTVTPPARRPRADQVHAVDQPTHESGRMAWVWVTWATRRPTLRAARARP